LKITLKAKSSSGDPYDVDFLIQNQKLYVQCNCKAGIYGQLCKHKTELIAGDDSRLFDESEKAKLSEVQLIISKIPEIGKHAEKIIESENKIQQEQAKLKTIRERFCTQLKGGFVIVEDAR